MSNRLTRKAIKHDIREDEVRSVLVRIFETVQDNPNLVIGAVAGLLVLVLTGSGLVAYFESRRDSASAELASAIKIVDAEVIEEGADPEDPDAPSFASEEERRASAKEAFEKVRQGVGSSVAGDVANLYLADIAASEGDTETAREIWESFVNRHADHVLALSVRLNLIHLDREGDAQEVAEELQRELDSAEKILPEDVILFELAKTLEVLEKPDEARELYQRILDEHPQSPYSATARRMTTFSS